MNCIVCGDNVSYFFNKGFVRYNQCGTCKTLFSLPLPNDNMVGGSQEEDRNKIHNPERIDRVKNILGGKKVLDYGCGNGMLLEDMKNAGLDCYGYDVFNPKFDKITENNYDVITLIEVIEHLSSPFKEIDEIYNLLKPGGFLYIETSFTDIAKEREISLKDFEYVNPNLGHSTIFSHRGLDILMLKKRFTPTSHINVNVRVYQK
jgi:ubiquinone/menaquinone biosynthesis C-methylase UbiE